MQGVAAGALIVLGAASPAFAESAKEAPRKTETHGLGISAGVGGPYVGLGFQAAYYLPLSGSRLRVAPYASLGWVLWALGPDEQDHLVIGTAAGLMASWGHRHRLTVEGYYGTAGTTSLSLHGEAPDTERECGPGAAVGYEYAASNGFFLRTSFGLQYVVTAPILAPSDRLVFGGTLIGIGYKLW